MAQGEFRKSRSVQKPAVPGKKKENSSSRLVFVVQQHAASHPHYDFRLEMQGVLKSWRVPQGPSLKPGDKRLALMTEDRPYDYKDFEGTIPEGYRNAGDVIVWDGGTYRAAGADEGDAGERHLLEGLKNGNISFVLEGRKLKGEFTLARVDETDPDAWVLVKTNDLHASDYDILRKSKSIKTQRTLNELKAPGLRKAPEPKKTVPLLKKKEIVRIQPMLAELSDKAFSNADWLFEVKYDGYRALANISEGQVDLYSRNHNSFAEAYPSIAEELAKLKHTAILDGEIVAEDEEGRSVFGLLQNAGNTPVQLKYYVFDLLHLNGYDMMEVPLRNRKDLLRMLLGPAQLKNVVYAEHAEADGLSFFRQACAKNYEGIIGKDGRSPYRVGRRSKEWLKVRVIQQQETVIAGITEPKGSRKFFGSLILAVREGNEWRYVGHCGTGFTASELARLYGLMQPLFTSHSPFSRRVRVNGKVQWLVPELVCQVKFSEWTADGNMRHPVYLGQRTDKPAYEVRKEGAAMNRIERAPRKRMASAASRKPASQAAGNKPSAKLLPGEKEYDLRVGKTVLHLTNQDKIYWPEENYTKGDLVAYYNRIAEFILPYLRERPQSMHRFPDGIRGQGFYQKDVDTEKVPSWLKTEKIYSPSNKEYIDYLICNDKATLLYMANLGCIEINPWNSRAGKPENPDWAVIDLDPEEIDFREVVEAALAVKETLDALDLDCYCKTSGASGLHVYIPLAAKYDYGSTRMFAELIAHLVHTKLPDTTSLLRSPAKRKHKVYLDYLQNSRGQTLAAPYSVRPRPGATVSTPLQWSEVNDKLDPRQFTMQNIFTRLEKLGDIWKPVTGRGENIGKALKKIRKMDAA